MSTYGNPTGFVSLQQWLDANKDGAESMAQKTAGAAMAPGVNTARGAADVQRNVGMLQTAPGQQAMLQKAMGKTANVSPLDAALTGAAGGNYFAQLKQQYGQAGTQALAAQKAQADAKRKALNQPQAKPTTIGDVQSQQQAALKSQADAIRAEDAKRPSGQMGRERWANLHGMSLEQWIERGMQPAF